MCEDSVDLLFSVKDQSNPFIEQRVQIIKKEPGYKTLFLFNNSIVPHLFSARVALDGKFVTQITNICNLKRDLKLSLSE